MSNIQPVGKTRGHVLKQIKTAQGHIIPDDGYADGGAPYDDDEMNIIDAEQQGFSYYSGGNTVRVEPVDNHAGVFPGLDLESKEIILHLDPQQQAMMRKIFGFDSEQEDSGLNAHGLPPNTSGPNPTRQ